MPFIENEKFESAALICFMARWRYCQVPDCGRRLPEHSKPYKLKWVLDEEARVPLVRRPKYSHKCMYVCSRCYRQNLDTGRPRRRKGRATPLPTVTEEPSIEKGLGENESPSYREEHQQQEEFQREEEEEQAQLSLFREEEPSEQQQPPLVLQFVDPATGETYCITARQYQVDKSG